MFEIVGLQAYPDNEIIIFNRLGHQVFYRKGYYNDWKGHCEEGMTLGESKLPQGIYFYVLNKGEDDSLIRGFVYLNSR